ncbi:MAG TPA: FAD-dependent oxidoreductase [Acidimicrobiia bacterium]|jgi:D-amino-acid dehydrogenase
MTSEQFDAVIVGGGLVGTALAYELAGMGIATALVDRHDRSRATDAGAGILSPETIGTPDEDWYRLAAASGEHYRTLVGALREDGDPDPGYAVCGALRVAFREIEDGSYVEQRALNLARAGSVLEDLSSDDAVRLLPVMAPMRAVLYNPRAARVDGRQMCAALGAAAVRRGLQRVDGSVTDLRRAGDRVSGVVVGDRVLGCEELVIAGGAWTPEVAELVGATLPIIPVRGQIVHLGTEADEVPTDRWPILQPVFSHYMVPWPGGRVAIGATVEPDAGFDARVTAGGMRQLLSEGLRLLPGLAEAELVEVRVGLRPVSADNSPVLGRIPGSPNVSVCTGHGANGLLLGPYSARLVAELVAGKEPSMELSPFGPERFG